MNNNFNVHDCNDPGSTSTHDKSKYSAPEMHTFQDLGPGVFCNDLGGGGSSGVLVQLNFYTDFSKFDPGFEP